MTNFSLWLVQELEKRGWPRTEAARRGGISSSAFDQVINGQTRPGIRFCRAVAKAFGISVEEVQRRAGILPAIGELLPEVVDWNARLQALTPERRAQVVQAMTGVLNVAEGRLAPG